MHWWYLNSMKHNYVNLTRFSFSLSMNTIFQITPVANQAFFFLFLNTEASKTHLSGSEKWERDFSISSLSPSGLSAIYIHANKAKKSQTFIFSQTEYSSILNGSYHCSCRRRASMFSGYGYGSTTSRYDLFVPNDINLTNREPIKFIMMTTMFESLPCFKSSFAMESSIVSAIVDVSLHREK